MRTFFNAVALLAIVVSLTLSGCTSPDRKSGEEVLFGENQAKPAEMTLSERYREKMASLDDAIAQKSLEALKQDKNVMDTALVAAGMLKVGKPSSEKKGGVNLLMAVAEEAAKKRDRAKLEYALLVLERDTLYHHLRLVEEGISTDWKGEARVYAEKRATVERLSVLSKLPYHFMIEAVHRKLDFDREGTILNVSAMAKSETDLLTELKHAADLFGTAVSIQPYEDEIAACDSVVKGVNEWRTKWDTTHCKLKPLHQIEAAVFYPKFPSY